MIVNISVYVGIVGCVSFAVFEYAKRSVESSLIKCTALRAYSAIIEGNDITFDGLREVYIQEMKQLTGVTGDLTEEDAWQIFLLIRDIAREDTTIDNNKRQWISRSGEKAIPRHHPSPKLEYFLASIVLAVFLYGLNQQKGLIGLVNLPLDQALMPSAFIVIPSLIILAITFLMAKWAIRSASYRN
ncbi:hypothetical protein [Candidatus Accumulibacter vicinus]|uniref:hypothetical protein n=1 Tax=Candidatus Accumulibacter vicinus TaxID=2954382 RepID=UPI00235B705C|nr:hypothetical protein [Candidatus Accumulibacter vicinus]